MLNVPSRGAFYARTIVAIALGVFTSCRIARADEAEPPGAAYHLGQGVTIPGTGFGLGGYATGSYDHSDDTPSRASLDNLSLFFWWDGGGRWKAFTEIEYDDLLLTRENLSRQDRKGENGYLSLERLYVDYALTDTTDVRAGKFLTPIGRWNLIHATPLVWTTSRPLATTLAFPTNMTGVMVTQTLPNVANGLEYSVYGSTGDEIRPNPALDTFTEAVGAHVTLPTLLDAQIGFSYAEFEQEHVAPAHRHLLGVDFLWMRARWEISAEAVYRYADNGGIPDEKGGFVQIVAPLSDKLYAVARYERFRTSTETRATQLRVTGLNYRITPALVLKAEWVSAAHNQIEAPEGFLASISVLL